ncbi:blue light receptor, partial [Blyttiomyces sp. JEL0837]
SASLLLRGGGSSSGAGAQQQQQQEFSFQQQQQQQQRNNTQNSNSMAQFAVPSPFRSSTTFQSQSQSSSLYPPLQQQQQSQQSSSTTSKQQQSSLEASRKAILAATFPQQQQQAQQGSEQQRDQLRNSASVGLSGIYSQSGFDLISILARIAARPNPVIAIGNVDLSCAFTVTDPRIQDNPIVYASETFSRLTGYSTAEILNRNCRFLQSPYGKVTPGSNRKYSDSLVAHQMKESIKEAKECQFSIINYRKSGDPFINLVTIIPLFVPGTRFVEYFVGFQVDLVEQPQAILNRCRDGSYIVDYKIADKIVVKNRGSDLVKDSSDLPPIPSSSMEKKSATNFLLEPLFQRFLETTDFVHILSLRARFLYASPVSLRKLLEYESESEIIGRELQEFIHPADLVSVMRELRRSQPRTPLSFLCRFRRKNSGYIYMEVRGHMFEGNISRKCFVLIGRQVCVNSLPYSISTHPETELWCKLSLQGMILFIASSSNTSNPSTSTTNLSIDHEVLNGSSILDYIHPEDKVSCSSVLKHVNETLMPAQGTWRVDFGRGVVAIGADGGGNGGGFGICRFFFLPDCGEGGVVRDLFCCVAMGVSGGDAQLVRPERHTNIFDIMKETRATSLHYELNQSQVLTIIVLQNIIFSQLKMQNKRLREEIESMVDESKRARRRVFALFIAVLTALRLRRSVPGLVAYLLVVALPKALLLKHVVRVIKQNLVGATFKPPFKAITNTTASTSTDDDDKEVCTDHEAVKYKLDIFTILLSDSVKWYLEKDFGGPPVQLMTVFAWFAKQFTKRILGGKIVHVKTSSKPGRGPVEGHWIVEETTDVPFEKVDGINKVFCLWIHGGGYNAGNSLTYADHGAKLVKRFNKQAKEAGRTDRLVVFSVEYPLAPEHPYPAALHSCADAYKYLVEEMGAETIIVGGSSAGGNMVVSIILKFPLGTPACVIVPPKSRPIFDYLNIGICHEWASNYVAGNNTKKISFLETQTPPRTISLVDSRISPVMLPDEVLGKVLGERGCLVVYGGAEYFAESIEVFVKKIKGVVPDGFLDVVVGDTMPHEFNMLYFMGAGKGPDEAAKALTKTVDFFLRVSREV